jgi:hypothetical protein
MPVFCRRMCSAESIIRRKSMSWGCITFLFCSCIANGAVYFFTWMCRAPAELSTVGSSYSASLRYCVNWATWHPHNNRKVTIEKTNCDCCTYDLRSNTGLVFILQSNDHIRYVARKKKQKIILSSECTVYSWVYFVLPPVFLIQRFLGV